jgi:hypothetical protein
MAIDPNYTGGITDYELSKEAERQKQMSPFRPGISDAEPAPGEMGPVDLTDQFTYEDPLDNMPGSTAGAHYTPEGDYTLGMTQRKKEKEAKQNNPALRQAKRQQGVNKALAIGNTIVGLKEQANALKMRLGRTSL